MKQKLSTKNIILVVLIILTVAFIFSNSVPSIPQSRVQSSTVKELIEPVLEVVVGKGNVTLRLVRKLAHICEYALLGFEVGLLFRRKLLSAQLLGGMTTALCDETIQIFSHRGSQILDVWIDFSGIILGIAFAAILLWIISLIRKRKTEEV